jgi:hypothetical protein
MTVSTWDWSRVNTHAPYIVPPPPVQQLEIGDWRTGPSGELLQLTNRKLTMNLTDPSTITFDVNGLPDPASGRFDAELLHEGVSDLIWRRNGKALARCRLTSTDDRVDSNGHNISCTAQDYRHLLERRLVLQDLTGVLANSGKKSFGAIPLNEIAWQLIADAQAEPGGDMGLKKGQWPHDLPVYNTYEVPDGDTVWAALKRLMAPASVAVVTEVLQPDGTHVIAANLLGFDLDIDANKRVNMWYGQRGTDRGVRVDFRNGEGGAIKSFTRTVDMENYANFIREAGGGNLNINQATNSVLRLPTKDLARRPEGRWDKDLSDPNVLTMASLRGIAARDSDIWMRLQPTYSLSLTAGFWEPDLIEVGDVINVVIESGRLNVNDKLRVQSIEVSLDSSDREDVVLTCGRPYYSVLNFLSTTVRDLNRR